MSQISFENSLEALQKSDKKDCQYGSASAFELENFLKSFSNILQNNSQKNISVTELSSFLNSFKKHLERERKSGQTINIFDVLGLGHDEKKHCMFLAWLLDPRGSHGHGGLFFHACIAQLTAYQGDKDILSGNYTVRTERCPLGDMADRVDIVCEGRDFLCYIEAKIDTWEHGNQTIRYWKKLATCANGRKTALIYLADGSKPACDSAIPLSWKTLSESLDRLREEPSCQLTPFLHELVRQYALFIRRFHGKG
ncbi:MAG: PD-(D/E)XK nuclease family protein [Desulfovibrionaceae bacterium]|nr:PD-(D/E)XK nuclease family protein [Desulfovibrionaceae bacterium]